MYGETTVTPRMVSMTNEPDYPPNGEAAGGKLPPSDSQADRLLRLVHWTSTASRHLRRQLAEVARTLGLSDTELLVVWLCSGGGRVQVDLAGAIGISPAQMSGMVERLRSRGLVAMHRLAMDRRRQMWRTSATGQALLAKAAGHLNELSVSIVGGLGDNEQETAQALCERLTETLATIARQPASKTMADHHDEQRASKEAA
jgi:DNA-binding MarR family transcriptional regulator